MPRVAHGSWRRNALMTAALACLTTGVAHNSACAQGAPNPPIRVGQRAPAAAVETLDGKATNLAQYVGRQPVLLEFWATWCRNCRQLEPALAAAQKRFGNRVRFVTVAVSVDQTPADVARYAREHGLTPDIVFDPTGAAVDAYGVPGTSFVVVLNTAGTVVYTGGGGDQDIVTAIWRAL